MPVRGNDAVRISYCFCGDQAIFLDIERDRYFTLRSRENKLFREHVALGSRYAPTPVSISEAEPCRPIPAPQRDLANVSPACRADLISVSSAILTYARWALALRRHGFARALASQSRVGLRRQSEMGVHPYGPIAAGFRPVGALSGFANNCLPRSLAFQALARRRGLATSLVFGVKTAPFEAHCWVQDDDLVLNDTVERVRIFTPILVVE